MENESRRLLSVAQFGERYGIGRSSTFDLLATGELRSIKVGARRLIPADAAEAWLHAKLEQQDGAA